MSDAVEVTAKKNNRPSSSLLFSLSLARSLSLFFSPSPPRNSLLLLTDVFSEHVHGDMKVVSPNNRQSRTVPDDHNTTTSLLFTSCGCVSIGVHEGKKDMDPPPSSNSLDVISVELRPLVSPHHHIPRDAPADDVSSNATRWDAAAVGAAAGSVANKNKQIMAAAPSQ